VKTVTTTEAEGKPNVLLAEVERTGESVTITKHGRSVAVLMPAHQRLCRFGQLLARAVTDAFDDHAFGRRYRGDVVSGFVNETRRNHRDAVRRGVMAGTGD
jgi:prevent-host-death family protein